MTNSKTRVRVARVAAGAVFAAGLSLTGAGAAQALDLGLNLGGDDGVNVGASVDEDGVGVNAVLGSDGGSADGGSDGGDTEGIVGGGTDDGGTTDGGADDGGAAAGGEDGGADDGGAAAGGADDGGAAAGGADDGGAAAGGNDDGGAAAGGNDDGGTDTDGGTTGGEEPATIGGSGGGDEDTPTCELSESEVNCDEGGGNTQPDTGGSQPVGQENAKEELAETGSAETTFLLIGAATMIAGGVGFRMMPRLVNKGGTVA